MNEKEISEIRRRYRSDRSNISRICGCYVNEKKEIVSKFEQSLGLMSEDDANGMLGVLKKTLSGRVGANLIEMEFSAEQVNSSPEYARLAALRDSELKDAELCDSLYSVIIENLELEGSYMIVLAYDTYDVFDVRADGTREEESTSVYSYVICSVCPIKEGKVVMSYYLPENCFRSICSDSTVSRPEAGFVFPVMEDKGTNIYKALYYTKNLENNYGELVKALFISDAPMPAAEQKNLFGEVLAESVGEECSLRVVSSLHAQINEAIEEAKADDDGEATLTLSARDACEMLRFCGVSEDKIDSFEEKFEESFGKGAEIPPSNLSGAKQLIVETPEATVRIGAGYNSAIETRIIDGVKYIMIRADKGVTVNGVNVHI